MEASSKHRRANGKNKMAPRDPSQGQREDDSHGLEDNPGMDPQLHAYHSPSVVSNRKSLMIDPFFRGPEMLVTQSELPGLNSST